MPIVGRDIALAAKKLRDGEAVAFATETVYGLGARADSEEAVAAMFAMKGRPRWHPAIVHLSSAAEAGEWAQMNPSAEKLAAAFWPGPLTLILPALPKARAAAGKEGAVALRMPSHPLARELLLRAGVGAAAPSANRFGKVSPTCAAHVAADFANEESLYVLDGGDCEAGIESSIVSCLDDRPALLRPGAVGEKQITAVVGALSSPPSVSSPGKLPSHYATKTPLFLAAADDIARINDDKTAVLSQTRPPQTSPALWRCAEKNPLPYARRLYALLRELDAIHPLRIVAEAPPTTEEWTASRDRLARASGGKTLTAADCRSAR